MVHVPTRDFPDGGFGFLITSAARDGKVKPSIVAFESPKECEEVHWLWASWPDIEPGSNRWDMPRATTLLEAHSGIMLHI